jgi:hypothetical protein
VGPGVLIGELAPKQASYPDIWICNYTDGDFDGVGHLPEQSGSRAVAQRRQALSEERAIANYPAGPVRRIAHFLGGNRSSESAKSRYCATVRLCKPTPAWSNPGPRALLERHIEPLVQRRNDRMSYAKN